MLLNFNSKVVFMGDSITDSNRRTGPDPMGEGYVRMIRDYLRVLMPEAELEVVNHGVDGDRVIDLRDRWDRDVIAVQPDWVSISIGINDVWRQIDHLYEPVFINEFTEVYRQLLTRTKAETDASIVLMETSVIEEDLSSEGNQLLVSYNHAIRDLAREFQAVLVPINQVFHGFITRNMQRTKLTSDGVHMTSTGNLLMALTWLQALNVTV